MLDTIVNKEHLAILMQMTFKKHFAYYLHRIPEDARYEVFHIPKKLVVREKSPLREVA